MSRYPIKMLKDEEGQPFVPLTHINAVTGAKYVQAIFETTKIDNTHYQISSDNLTIDDIRDKFIVVRFGETKKSNATSYIKMNSSPSYPIVAPDGDILEIGDLSNSVCLFNFTDDKWVTIGSTSGGGHKIVDTDGNIMTQRSVLNFVNFDIKDDAGNGATQVINNNWVKSFSVESKTLDINKWIGLLETPITIPEQGLYRVDVRIQMRDITTISKEIGVRIDGVETWKYQHRRLKDYYTFYISNPTTINPEIYVDAITSDSSNILGSAHIFIEKLNKID